MTIRSPVFASALVASALLVPVAALAAPAAAAPPQVSSDQLVCDLTGDCGDTPAAPTQDKPETRGFSIVHVGSAQQPAAAAAPAAARPERRTAARMVPTGAPAAQPGRARAPRGEVGHANLAIAFLSGSATLTSAGKVTADQFAKALQSPALASKRFMIGGHTSAVGSRPYNQDLSERRAQAVVDYLVSQGANRTQFDAKGFGFDSPMAGTAASSPENRRVEVVALP
ncbi:OmpA family protein [Novosphingobium sp.]|uniref:OmpA family protein n=1 Tax=Novosphingobium sp. TaxID=1874826 RepID=UPI0033406C8E